MTDHDFNGNESVIPSDIEYTLSRIGTIADSVDSSMTVGEIVRRVDWLQCIRQSDEGRMT